MAKDFTIFGFSDIERRETQAALKEQVGRGAKASYVWPIDQPHYVVRWDPYGTRPEAGNRVVYVAAGLAEAVKEAIRRSVAARDLAHSTIVAYSVHSGDGTLLSRYFKEREIIEETAPLWA